MPGPTGTTCYAYIGGLEHGMLAGIGKDTLALTIPESLFAMYQLTFAIITPALVAAVVVGKRTGIPSVAMLPHNRTMAVTGAGMLWVGWFGFNGGSGLAVHSEKRGLR